MTAEPSRWGVWDNHLREWVVTPDHAYERTAWAALLAVESLHPWELEVRAENDAPAVGVVMAECPECMSTGECDGCGRECLRCDGSGEMPWDELTDYERDRLKRRGAVPVGAAA